MLTANVLCLKRKKKKKGDYILNLPDTIIINDGKAKGQKTGNMLHITEDTPADMLSGAMDLTIHLPSGKAVKMCVERRTPMMDLLVQVTTNHQLQITNYTLQPLQTSSNDNYSEKVLSYYPNTPIGALDTQHIKVIPKTRTLPIKKNVPPGPQPFETTFRLKVHLPRNQLYVTRVSKHVHIEDIMRKVCEEKNLDTNKYEVRHPGNLDEVLDPKLTLNDYMITEINLVVKGSNAPTQSFTSEDIMTLRKDEERKAVPNKTGGVFNLLFRRGKSNNVSTPAPPTFKEPTSSSNREDQSTKSTPQIIPIAKLEPQKEKPKVPQRKRRPAPKPPQTADKPPQTGDKPPTEEPVQMRTGSVISDNSTASDNGARNEPVLTICHSRHSSDSSGYHETSILSDQCNTSLPRRNRLEETETMVRKLNRYSESTGNLTKMTSHSRSTSSLIFPGRKKKAAPPPPKPLQKFTSSTTNLESLSPVVASQTPLSSSSSKTDLSLASQATQKTTNPPPVPRRRKGPVATSISVNEEGETISEIFLKNETDSMYSCPYQTEGIHAKDTPDNSRPPSNMSTIDILKSLEYLNLDDQGNEIKPPEVIGVLPKSNQVNEEAPEEDTALKKRPFILNLVDKNLDDDNTSITTESPIKNEMISLMSDVSSIDIPPRKKQYQKELSVSSVKSSESVFFEEGRIRRWGSWEKLNESSLTSSPIDEEPGCSTSEVEASENPRRVSEIADTAKYENVQNMDEYSSREILCREEKHTDEAAEEENKHMIHSMEGEVKSLQPEDTGMYESKNLDRMDSILSASKSELSFDGVYSHTDLSSTSSHPVHKILVPSEKTFTDVKTTPPVEENKVIDRENVYTNNVINEISLDDVERYKTYGNSPDSGNSSEISEKMKIDDELSNPEILDVLVSNEEEMEEWQLPSPPKAFKDTFPNSHDTDNEKTETDSVITPELIEKLEIIEKQQSLQDRSNIPSDDSDLILSKLSLENLEKRKSLVYNRELATSLKQSYESQARKEDDASSAPPLSNSSIKTDEIEKVLDEIRNNTKKEEETSMDVKHSSTLPNFKITTYDEPKQIKVFEDDTIRSNSDFSGKSLSLNRGKTLPTAGFRRSMENISIRRNESEPKEVDQHRIFRPKSDHYRRPRAVNRSGSFSVEQNEWSSSKPVARSKSQVAVRRGEKKINGFETGQMSKSSSLFDVSGLQSLEVMKKIQNKLNTPTTSMETLSKVGSEKKVETKPKEVEMEEVPIRKYQYAGPPSINMGTWSDRPKVPVSVKEDADYKLGQGTNRRHYNGTRISDSSQQRYSNDNVLRSSELQRVTVTCNGPSEQRNDFNVLIKIEDQNRRYPEHNVDSIYRTTYGFNRNSQRPHSVAFPSDFDISRVPVVRSVELKKTFRDTNTSVTQLNQSSDNYYSNGFSDKSRAFNSQDIIGKDNSKPVLRAKSFLQTAPVVRGFRPLENSISNNNDSKVEKYSRSSWQPTTTMTLPANPRKDTHATNQNVPFSRFNLRRTESKCLKDDVINNPSDLNQAADIMLPSLLKSSETSAQVFCNTTNSTAKSVIPKPPPQMPTSIQKKITKRQFVPVADPRDELLKSIRDFGGKKGLRSRKA